MPKRKLRVPARARVTNLEDVAATRTEALAGGGTPPITPMADRIFVLASVLLAAFTLSGAALSFGSAVDAWAGLNAADAGAAAWRASLMQLHSQTAFVATLGVLALLYHVMAWTQMLRAPDPLLSSVSLDDPPSTPPRSVQLRARFRQSLRRGLPLILVVASSGVALLLVLSTDLQSHLSEAMLAHLQAFHGARLLGSAQPFLWMWAGGNLVLLSVYTARIRAAQLQERGVQSFRAYEDIPQGAALGLLLSTLVSLVVIAWGGPAELIPTLFIFGLCWCIGMHLWSPLAESGGWRWIPLSIFSLVVIGDLFASKALIGATWMVWAGSFALAVIATLVARLGRRTLAH